MTLTNYWWLLIWLFTGGAVLAVAFPRCQETVLGEAKERWAILPAVLCVIPFILWAGFRPDIFGDTYAYRKAFLNMPTDPALWWEYLSGIKKDVGFSVLSLLLKKITGESSEFYFLLIAAFQMLSVALVYRKYSCNYWLGLFLFIATTDYMSWTFNGMRQFVAVTIIFAATGLILREKYISAILVVLLASTMHQSALLMLPIIFIIRGKAWNIKTLLAIAASVAVLFFVDQFTDLLDGMLEDTQYTNMISDWKQWDDNGTNPLRVLVYSVPTILSVVGMRHIRAVDDPVVNMATNASIISTALYIVSMATSGIFIGRLPIYVSLWATGILLPWEIKHMFTRESARLVAVLAVILFTAFFYYQMHVTWGVM